MYIHMDIFRISIDINVHSPECPSGR